MARNERRHRRRMRRLRFFAAERTTHSFRLDNDLAHVQTEEMCDDFLHLGRMLSQRKRGKRSMLAMNHQCCLRLHIKLILSAALEYPFENMVRGRERRIRIT